LKNWVAADPDSKSATRFTAFPIQPCNGAYADYIVVRESELALKPNPFNHIRAAAVPMAALTAWQSLFDTAQLRPVKE
jgi:NADPH:quinone reductase-like Zn-dependent oxidoreductase